MTGAAARTRHRFAKAYGAVQRARELAQRLRDHTGKLRLAGVEGHFARLFGETSSSLEELAAAVAGMIEVLVEAPEPPPPSRRRRRRKVVGRG